MAELDALELLVTPARPQPRELEWADLGRLTYLQAVIKARQPLLWRSFDTWCLSRVVRKAGKCHQALKGGGGDSVALAAWRGSTWGAAHTCNRQHCAPRLHFSLYAKLV